MLPIILLGITAKFAVVSADCQINAVHNNFTDWANVS
jgi:hypothetical protein